MLVAEGSKLLYQADGTTIGLDCPAGVSFVSHAHFDHVPASLKSPKLVCSKPTLELMHARGIPKERGEHGEGEKMGVVKISLLDAGHILGSRKLLVEQPEETFLYTADFKTEDSILFSGAKPVACDTLLVESTYGMPKFRFPDRESVYGEIASWTRAEIAKGCVVLGGYALGKSQELIKVLNEHLGVTPVVTDDIAEICEVYKKNGIELEYLRASSNEGREALQRRFVAVLPQHKVNSGLAAGLSKQYGQPVATAVATGWAADQGNRFDVDRAFCLSDHCDFMGLCDYVEATGAKNVYVNHGYSRELARALKKLGHRAISVEDMKTVKGQQKLVQKRGARAGWMRGHPARLITFTTNVAFYGGGSCCPKKRLRRRNADT